MSEEDRQRENGRLLATTFRSASFPPPTTMSSGAARKLADPTKYHLAPKGFWKKFRALALFYGNIP
jgi:hypothetical protein